MKVIIVVPTYNEKENIGRLLDSLPQILEERPQHDFKVLVVDGNSPDGTGDEVRKRKKDFDFVELLLEEKKAGIGAAYFQGFKHSIKEFSPDVLVEMDGDLQHDPKDILRLVDAIEAGADYAVGSRFIEGGGIPDDWEFYRKFLSVGGNIFSKIVLGIYNVNDFTSGFKASRVKGFVDKLDLDTVMSAGFAYKIDLLFKMHQLGAKIVEVPIVFRLRDGGKSKMEKSNFLDSLKVVLALRIQHNKSFFKFAAVGVVGLVVDTGLFNIFRIALPYGSSISAVFSGGVAMLTTFLLNNYWSFGDRKLEGANKKITGIVVYFVSSTVPIIVRSKIVEYFTAWFGDTFIISNTAFFIGIVFGLIWNFTVYSRIIWKNKEK
jgi:dolichol-phosphate mannosyltransferase